MFGQELRLRASGSFPVASRIPSMGQISTFQHGTLLGLADRGYRVVL